MSFFKWSDKTWVRIQKLLPRSTCLLGGEKMGPQRVEEGRRKNGRAHAAGAKMGIGKSFSADSKSAFQ